jgi:hypothetical protein
LDRFGAYLGVGDPLADAVVETWQALRPAERDAQLQLALDKGIDALPKPSAALRALFAQLDRAPFWFDQGRAEVGGSAFLGTGWFGSSVLGLLSLVGGYCSPAGNKPLAFSGRLVESVPRRLAETGHFVRAVSMPGGMSRFGEGFKTAVKVRMMHASVRFLLENDPRWRREEWGRPINQADMAGTVLLFSHQVLDGLRKMGVCLSVAESEGLLHLWRYTGYLMGVEQDLLVASEAEGDALWAMIRGTQGPPDADSRALAKALLENARVQAKTPEQARLAERLVPFAYGLSRYLLGDELADGLHYPDSSWRLVFPAMQPVVRRAHGALVRSPLGKRAFEQWGQRYWTILVEQGLAGKPATFSSTAAMISRPGAP